MTSYTELSTYSLNELKGDALESCECYRGHEMKEWSDFQQRDGSPPTSAFTSCRRCGMGVTVRTNPAPNDTYIAGRAVALTCEPWYPYYVENAPEDPMYHAEMVGNTIPPYIIPIYGVAYRPEDGELVFFTKVNGIWRGIKESFFREHYRIITNWW